MIFNLRFVSVLPNAISLRYQTSALDAWRVSARSVMKAVVGVVTKKHEQVLGPGPGVRGGATSNHSGR
jgi:hypothetical protein